MGVRVDEGVFGLDDLGRHGCLYRTGGGVRSPDGGGLAQISHVEVMAGPQQLLGPYMRDSGTMRN